MAKIADPKTIKMLGGIVTLKKAIAVKPAASAPTTPKENVAAIKAAKHRRRRLANAIGL